MCFHISSYQISVVKDVHSLKIQDKYKEFQDEYIKGLESGECYLDE